MARSIFTENYNSVLERIEDHIFQTTGSLEPIGKFLDEHDRALTFIDQNPAVPAIPRSPETNLGFLAMADTGCSSGAFSIAAN